MNAPTAAVSEAFCELVRTYNACMQKTLSKYGLYPGQPQVLFAISKLGLAHADRACGAAWDNKGQRGNVAKAA